MASITFSGQLDQAMNEAAAEGNKILFIPQQTVGEVLPGAASELVVESDGSYSITLAYNTYSIYHYSDVTKKKTLIANSVVVSADTAVSTIPDLIGSTVPVTEDSVLTIQGYLTEAQDSAAAAATSESSAAASEALVTNRVAAYEAESTEYLIDTFDGSDLETGDVVRTLGYYTAGDGGGADWIKTGEAGAASQSVNDTSASTINDSLGNEFSMSSEFYKNAKSFGVFDSSDDLSGAMQAIADSALSSSEPLVRLNGDLSAVPTYSNRSNVVMVGSGSIEGTNYDSGAYRRDVIDSLAPYASSAVDTRMSLDVANDEVTIVLCGDSLTTYYANAIASSGTLAGMLLSKLMNDNPSVDIDFYDRGIGGLTFNELNGEPSVNSDNYPWWDGTYTAWLDYISDLNPDYVFVSMGMNDKQNFDRAEMESVVSKIEAMGAKPVLITNMVPNLSPADDQTVGDYDDQEGRDFVAGYVRSYAHFYDIPLIDINRTFNMVRDGRDILDTYLVKTFPETYSEATRFDADDSERCRDFAAEITVESGAFSDSSNPFSVKLNDLSSVTNSMIFIDDNSGSGYLRFRFYRGGSSSIYQTVESDIETPSDECTFEITVTGNIFTFRILNSGNSTSPGIQPYAWKIIRHGGLFSPGFGYFTGGSGPITWIRYSYGVEKKVKPLITDWDLWGDTSGVTNSVYTTGGNAINHPTAKGAAIVYGEHFKRQNYKFNKIPYVYEDDDGVTGYTKYPDGRLECYTVMTFSDGAQTATGSMYYGTNQSLTYPISFTSVNDISINPKNYNLWGVTNGGTMSTLGVNIVSPLSVTASVDVIVKATGRWD